jgi:two-component system LytT family response regulator
MTFIALDDEPLALVLIQKYAQEMPDVQLLATFIDAAAAARFLQENPVDLLLTDINMPDVSGLQFVRDLPDERPMVIFVTAHKEHAHEGFDLDVVDYLVKPLSPERFRKAMKKSADLLALRQKSENVADIQPLSEAYFFVFSEYQQVKILIKDILYIESMGDYIKIHLETQSRPVLTLERIKNLTQRLEKHGFRRIHRSFLINTEKVEIKRRSQVCIAGIWLPVGSTYADPSHL